MTLRTALLIALLTAAAILSYFLGGGDNARPSAPAATENNYPGYYIVGATVRGIGSDGQYLYSLTANEAIQTASGDGIDLNEVKLNYTGDAAIPWTLNAAHGAISADGRTVRLSGGVTAVSTDDGVVTALETESLELEPERYTAKTDDRVTLRVGSQTLSATGVLAFLNEDRIEFHSNVSGKFLP